ncbi:MAG: hypothetical protein ACUVXF_04415 [Desulfobaccales bacterium]
MNSARFRSLGPGLVLAAACTMFGIGLSLCLPALSVPGSGTSSATALAASPSPGAYTPPAGSAERQAIIKALRQKLYSLHQVEAIFEVDYLKVHQGWAWIHASPRSRDGRQHYEPVYALLRQEGGHWQVVKFPCTEEDNPDCVGHPGFFQKLRARFPGAPRGIFPQ